jgi:PTH1 family peptidyl-tRNA hydrolase
MAAHLIVGLGNPGPQYEKTRHNVGVRVVGTFWADHKEAFGDLKGKFEAMVAEGRVGTKKVVLMIPGSYFMNESGKPVKDAAAFWKVPAKNVVVVYDDKDLPMGSIRIRGEGSAGGHNGMKSVIEHFKTQKIPRIRVGIGTPRAKKADAADFVMGKFSPGESLKMHESLVRAAQAVETILTEGLDKAMNEFNA